MKYEIVPDEFVTPSPWNQVAGIKMALGLPAYGGSITSAVVRAVAPGGPAEIAGIKVGDRVLGPNGEPGP
jgi:S1-C subfamily serine protease